MAHASEEFVAAQPFGQVADRQRPTLALAIRLLPGDELDAGVRVQIEIELLFAALALLEVDPECNFGAGFACGAGITAVAVCTGALGSVAGVWRCAGAEVHPATTNVSTTNGAKARRPVNSTVNSHPRGVNVYRFRNVTVLG